MSIIKYAQHPDLYSQSSSLSAFNSVFTSFKPVFTAFRSVFTPLKPVFKHPNQFSQLSNQSSQHPNQPIQYQHRRPLDQIIRPTKMQLKSIITFFLLAVPAISVSDIPERDLVWESYLDKASIQVLIRNNAKCYLQCKEGCKTFPTSRQQQCFETHCKEYVTTGRCLRASLQTKKGGKK